MDTSFLVFMNHVFKRDTATYFEDVNQLLLSLYEPCALEWYLLWGHEPFHITSLWTTYFKVILTLRMWTSFPVWEFHTLMEKSLTAVITKESSMFQETIVTRNLLTSSKSFLFVLKFEIKNFQLYICYMYTNAFLKLYCSKIYLLIF